MSLKERIYSVLIVSASDSFNNTLADLLSVSKYSPQIVLKSVAAAKRNVLERVYDLIIINSPLPDDDATRFAIDLCESKSSVVLLFTRSEIYDEVYDRAAEHGVYVLQKPTSKSIITAALGWMASTRERLRKAEKKTLSLEEKMDEIRTVNRAKWVLICELKMSESEAHRFIEKQAMDRCITKREVAESIIKTYI